MFLIEDGKIYLTKGDDAQITINLTDDSGTAYSPQDGDELILTVKRMPAADSEALITIQAAGSVFVIGHGDTADMAVGEYSADIQLKTSGGLRYTVWPTLDTGARKKERNYRNFIVMPEVTVQ